MSYSSFWFSAANQYNPLIVLSEKFVTKDVFCEKIVENEVKENANGKIYVRDITEPNILETTFDFE
jgi:hypothetical protein